ncbi:MAG: tellurite resistance TerB family protein [Acidobacteria bacterium]|nr:tellurite resistance TerB family protein [Acidobacteriota bacterium]
MSMFLRGVLGSGGRKRARRVGRFVSGHKGFLSASTLLAAAGVAWGIFDSLQPGASAAGAASGAAPAAPGTSQASGGPGLAPQVANALGARHALGASPAPPIPGSANVPAEIVRIVRLAISAARADGTLSAEERALILQHARDAGIEHLVGAELDRSLPLADIAAGVSDLQQRQELYVLAFAIVRADESVNGAERIYLAQLANQLHLDPATASRLEHETAAKIDAAAEND